MIKKLSRNIMRVSRHKRVRNKISGTPEIPRLCVFRSNQFISAQIIDDENGITLASATSKGLKLANLKNKEAATKVGELIAEAAKKLKITKVVFDRGGYLYHGSVAALAEAARNSGLEF